MKKDVPRNKLTAYIPIWVFGLIIIMAGTFLTCCSLPAPYAKIIADSEKAIAKNPKDTEAYMQSGMIYLQLGNYRKALEKFSIRSQIPPSDINTVDYIGLCYKELGYFSKALDQYNKILPVDKQLADKLLNQITR